MYKIVNRRKRAIVTTIDLLGKAIFRLLRLSKHPAREIQVEGIRKILLIRLAYLGDVILALPVLEPLRAKFPKAEISFLTSSQAKELLEGNPLVDKVIVYDAFWFYGWSGWQSLQEYLKLIRLIRQKRFDLVIDLRGDLRNILFILCPSRAPERVSYAVTGGSYLLTRVVPFRGIKHKVEFHLDTLRTLGIRIPEADFPLPIGAQDRESVEDLFSRWKIKEDELVVAIHPGGRLRLKRWFPERFAAVADALVRDHQARVLILGARGEEDIAAEIVSRMEERPEVVVGKTNLRELACLIGRCHLFIGNDSAPLHLSAAVGTPAVAIFGPSDSRETGPWGESHRVVEREMACRPGCDEHSCGNNRYQDCMRGISVSDVISYIDEVLRLR